MYTLRYYKEIALDNKDDSSIVRLEIYQKDGYGSAVEIGPVLRSLNLEIQGQDNQIEAPIVKTSLVMTFVDAYDLTDGKKNGLWEEFYTPDALYWKVVVKVGAADEQDKREVWSGYVTPDSYSESLSYRGDVTIIARDNIGHMQDFAFDSEGDADGMISLYDLLTTAWSKADCSMHLDWRGNEDASVWLQCDGIPAYDTLMNVAAFKDKNWYEAVEMALLSYGLVLRYVGGNSFLVSSLRYMPYQGKASMDELTRINPIFLSHADRELVPSIKRIEESISYDLTTSKGIGRIEEGDFAGSSNSYQCRVEGVEVNGQSWGILEHAAPIWPINSNSAGWDNIQSSSLFFDQKKYSIGYFSEKAGLSDDIYQAMYIAANNLDDRLVWFTKTITCSDLTFKIQFGRPISINSSNKLEQLRDSIRLRKVTISVQLTIDGVVKFYSGNGYWSSDYKEIEQIYDPMSDIQEYSLGISFDAEDMTSFGLLKVGIVKIEYVLVGPPGLAKTGIYAKILNMGFAQSEGMALLEKNTVITKFSDQNNIILTRSPELGPALNNVAFPGYIKNGIFYRDGHQILPAKLWAWPDSTPQQMAVYNHLQLLCYYIKPNNSISGTILNSRIDSFPGLYVWNNAEHLLISGSFNLLNGQIESAILREFARYESLWGDIGASLPDVEEESMSDVESSAASSGPTSTYDNTTTVLVGNGGSGGVSSIKLNSIIYYPDAAGQISLPSYPTLALTDQDIYTALGYIPAAKTYVDNLLTKYLPLSGGTITASVGEMPLRVQSAVASRALVGFSDIDSLALGYIGFVDEGKPGWVSRLGTNYEFIHTGNVDSYVSDSVASAMGSYLPKTGGTLTGTLTIATFSDTKLILDNQDDEQYLSFISFRQKGVQYGRLGTNINSTDLQWNSYVILHANNYTNYVLAKKNSMLFDDYGNYVAARFNDENLSIEAATTYIEWASNKGWMNHKAGKFITNGGTSEHFVMGDGSLLLSTNSDFKAKTLALTTQYTDTWNVDLGDGKIQTLRSISNSTEAPMNYCSGLSVMTQYTGFQLASYGGPGNAFYYRSVKDDGTWQSWREFIFKDTDTIDVQYYKCLGSVVLSRGNEDADTVVNYGPFSSKNNALILYGSRLSVYNKDGYTFSIDASGNANFRKNLQIASGNLYVGGEIQGLTPEGGSYHRSRMYYSPVAGNEDASGFRIQAATSDGLLKNGNIFLSGYSGEAANKISLTANDIFLVGKSTFKLGKATFEAGVEITGISQFPLSVKATSNVGSFVSFADAGSGVLGHLGISSDRKPTFITYNGGTYELLHKNSLDSCNVSINFIDMEEHHDTDMSQTELNGYGLTSSVISNLKAGKYNKAISSDNTEVWDYTIDGDMMCFKCCQKTVYLTKNSDGTWYIEFL